MAQRLLCVTSLVCYMIIRAGMKNSCVAPAHCFRGRIRPYHRLAQASRSSVASVDHLFSLVQLFLQLIFGGQVPEAFP